MIEWLSSFILNFLGVCLLHFLSFGVWVSIMRGVGILVGTGATNFVARVETMRN